MRRRLLLIAIPLVVSLVAAAIVIPGLLAQPAPASLAPKPGPTATPDGDRWADLIASHADSEQRISSELAESAQGRSIASQVDGRADPDFFTPGEADYVWGLMIEDYPLPLPPGYEWPTSAPIGLKIDDGSLFEEGSQYSLGTHYWRCAWVETALAHERAPVPGLSEAHLADMLEAFWDRAPNPPEPSGEEGRAELAKAAERWGLGTLEFESFLMDCDQIEWPGR